YRKYAPQGLGLDALRPLGAVKAVEWKWTPPSFTRALVAELWFYPDGSRLLELSTKCRPMKAFHVLAETRIFLKKRGLSLNGNQQTKTRKALEYFLHENRDNKKWPAVRERAMRLLIASELIFLLMAVSSIAQQESTRTLRIYVVDVEGGNATLFASQ